MRTISIRLEDLEKVQIPLGFMGENKRTTILIDCKKVFDEYSDAIPAMTVNPPDGEAYPAIIARNGDIVSWEVTDSDLIYEGNGELQLSFTEGEVVARTYIGRTRVFRSIVPTGEVPEPLDDFLARASEALSAIPFTIYAALEEAKESGEFDGADGFSPVVSVKTITGGHEITITDATHTTVINVMDGADGAAGADGQPGSDGFSPVAEVVKNGGVATITITDKNGETHAYVYDGADGETPEFSIDSVETLPAGSTATVTVDITDPTHPLLSFGIPKGDKGDDGDPATDEQVAEAVDDWLTAHPEATTTVQDGSITKAKLNSSLSSEIDGKAPAIVIDTEEGYCHEVVNPMSVTFVGNNLAFKPCRFADHQNMLPGRISSSTLTDLDCSITGNIIQIDGSPARERTYRPYSGLDVNIPAGNYTMRYEIDKGSTVFGDNAINGTVYVTYEDDTEARVVNAWLKDYDREYSVVLSKNVKKIYVNVILPTGNTYSDFKMFIGLYDANTVIVNTNETISDGQTYTYTNSSLDPLTVIDTMQHRSTAKIVADTKTYVDNLDIDLLEELSYVAPEMFGAKGDNTTDDSVAFALCIAYAKEHKKSIMAYKKYKTTLPISISNDGTTEVLAETIEIFVNCINYTGNDAAVIIAGRDIHFRANTINSSNVGLRLQGVVGKSNSFNTIETDYIYSTGNCIEVKNGTNDPTTGGALMPYNTFKFNHLKATSGNGILIDHSYGEKTFFCGDIVVNTGWSIMTYDSCDTFYTPNMETTHGIYLRGMDNAGNTFFCGRFRELVDKYGTDQNDPYLGVLVKFDYIGHNNLFFARDIVPAKTIDISEQSDAPSQDPAWKGATRMKFFGANMCATDYYYYSCDGQEILVRYNRVVVSKPQNREYEVTSPTMDMRGYETNYSLYTRFVAGSTSTIYLNESYCSVGIDKFRINQTSSNKLTIYDCRGNLVFDGSEHDEGEYEISCIYDASSSRYNDVEHDKFIVQKLNIVS